MRLKNQLNNTLPIKGTKRTIVCQECPQYCRNSLLLYFLRLNSYWLEELSISLGRPWHIRCSRQQGGMLIALKGRVHSLTSTYPSCTIICSWLLQVPHHLPLTVCQLINPAVAEEPCLSPLEWWALTVRTNKRAVKRRSRIFFLPYPTSTHYSPLPAKFKYMTQHCDSSDEPCIFLCTFLFCLSFFVSFIPSAFSVCFLHTPAVDPF